jgi:hypothetical protein
MEGHLPSETINTSGGAVVGGNVTTHGDFVGRDKIVHLHTDATQLAEALNILRDQLSKLTQAAPTESIDALGIVLDEISKLYLDVESELVRYLSLFFDPTRDLPQERAVLLTLEGGKVRARAGETRGHCHKINVIYKRQLRDWFKQNLSSNDFDQVNQAFELMGENDRTIVQTIEEMALWLGQEATTTLDLVDDNKLDDANRKVRVARKGCAAFRLTLANSLSAMRTLQAELIAATE